MTLQPGALSQPHFYAAKVLEFTTVGPPQPISAAHMTGRVWILGVAQGRIASQLAGRGRPAQHRHQEATIIVTNGTDHPTVACAEALSASNVSAWAGPTRAEVTAAIKHAVRIRCARRQAADSSPANSPGRRPRRRRGRHDAPRRPPSGPVSRVRVVAVYASARRVPPRVPGYGRATTVPAQERRPR
jgi:hypothetical protein